MNNTDTDSPDGGMVSKARIDESLEVQLRNADRTPPAQEKMKAHNTTGPASTETSDSIKTVKDKIKYLNKKTSESDVTRIRPGGPSGWNKKSSKNCVGNPDDSSHGTESFAMLNPEEKGWMVLCSHSDYQDMNRLLSRNPEFAQLKDITNGYTALHWAAKSGKSEVIKLLVNKPGVSINQRSYGGYTALHLAAIHGHIDVIELLVHTYKADANLRDYSGKKAKHYIKSSAKTLRSIIPLENTLPRSKHLGVTAQAMGLSSLMQAMTSFATQPLLMPDHPGGPDSTRDDVDGALLIVAGSAASSPSTCRRDIPSDVELLPLEGQTDQ